MKLKLLSAAAMVAMMAVPALAVAGDETGWYVRGDVGYGTHTDIDITGDMVGDVQSEGNGTGSVGVGYEFGNNWRLEGDYATLETDMGGIDNLPSSYAKLKTDAYMLNLLYDFSDFNRWEPYVGAGLGIVNAKAKNVAHAFLNPGYTLNPVCQGGEDACATSSSDNGFGWQLLAGLGYDVTDNLTWDTHYRYLNVGDMDFEGHKSNYTSPSSVSSSVANVTEEGIGAHSVMTGFRYRFGAAAPKVSCWDGSMVKMMGDCPMQPEPEPVVEQTQTCWDGSTIALSSTCPVRTKVCWDNSTIAYEASCPAQPSYTCWDNTIVSDASQCSAQVTDRGNVVTDLCGTEYRTEIIYYDLNAGHSPETERTIGRILDTGDYCRVDNIRVVGHTDRSGSAAYNMSLSQRRAKDARDELVRQGINSALITSEGKGETTPMIPTDDGVKEPLNRRTEVLIKLSETGSIIN